MTIENKTVLKAHELIKKRIEALVEKKQGLRDRIDEKWPADCYGIKGDMIFDEKSKEIQEELDLLRAYDRGFYDLIEGVEREMGRRKNRKL